MAESAYFFREEAPAARGWQFQPEEAERVKQPVLLMEGGEGRKHGPLSQQVTALAATLLPQSEIVVIENTNHMMPLQDPDALGAALANFLRRHPIVS